VECPLEELEHRERQRADRTPGQAKWQYEHIHGHGIYDLTVNTFDMTPEACAEAILAMLARPEEWRAFHKLQSTSLG
jgi:chloramphenicol 3-O phosphotransferase